MEKIVKRQVVSRGAISKRFYQKYRYIVNFSLLHQDGVRVDKVEKFQG